MRSYNVLQPSYTKQNRATVGAHCRRQAATSC